MIVEDVGKRWVIVHDEPMERVRRYPVPGGWLYQVQLDSMSVSDGNATSHDGWHPPIFVPDPRQP